MSFPNKTQVARKVVEDRVIILLIMLNWTFRSWLSQVMEMSLCPSWELPHTEDHWYRSYLWSISGQVGTGVLYLMRIHHWKLGYPDRLVDVLLQSRKGLHNQNLLQYLAGSHLLQLGLNSKSASNKSCLHFHFDGFIEGMDISILSIHVAACTLEAFWVFTWKKSCITNSCFHINESSGKALSFYKY